MKIESKLLVIQSELKAPKSQRNTFGNYDYRSCEDILEAVKPLLQKVKAVLTLKDEVMYIGQRYYIGATATLKDCESEEYISNFALAREEETKKGMDGSQITGASSSYARKYALNGLFAIDDTKDSDITNKEKKTKTNNAETNKKEVQRNQKASPKQIELLAKNYTGENLAKLLQVNKIEKLEDISITKASELIKKIYEKGGNQ